MAIAQRHELPELVARVLAGRGVTAEAAPEFLNPTLKSLMPNPSTLTDMDRLAERIVVAIESGERIAIFGDYDVDGATSAALLTRFLRAQGVEPSIYIPDRLFEGYGPNPEAMRTLAEEGVQLVIAVDCGTTSFAALETARELGVDVVVIDHHQTGVDLPPTVALVNPNRQDDLSGLGQLCAVGLTFLTVVAVNRLLRERGWYGSGRSAPDLLQWLDLVAAGTVCDVVPLGRPQSCVRRQGIESADIWQQSRYGFAYRECAPARHAYNLSPRVHDWTAHQCRRSDRRRGAGRAPARQRRSGGVGGAGIRVGAEQIDAGDHVWLEIDLLNRVRPRRRVVLETRVVWGARARLGLMFAGATQYAS